MRIDLCERADLVWGVDRLERDGELVRFLRMPEGLEEHYSDTEPRRIRRKCTPGARIVLRTDSPWLRMSVEYGGAARKLYLLDVFVDGKQLDSIGTAEDSGAPWKGETFRFEERKEHVGVVWLTHCSETTVREFEVEDSSKVEAVPKPAKSWLAIGDSITQGMTCRTPSRTYSALAAAKLGLELRNVGVGGGRMDAELGALCRSIPADVATVAFGANDFNGSIPLATYAANTRKVLEDLLRGRPTSPIGLVTPTPWMRPMERNEAGHVLEDYRVLLREVATDYPSVLVIEGEQMIPSEEKYFVDGVHPNDEGMASYSENLGPILRQML